MTFSSIASSSDGNAYIVDNGTDKLLIECGIPIKQLQIKLDHAVHTLRGCLISHEHKDHCKSADDIIACGVPVYASEGTAIEIGNKQINILSPPEVAVVGTYKILPFKLFHDAADPLGFYIMDMFTGEKLLFATDTYNIAYNVKDVTIAALECNYLTAILEKSEKLNEKVKQRIMRNHFEIGRLLEYIKTITLTKCREIYLLHLSDACSDELLFVNMIKTLCAEMGAPNVKVMACRKG